LDDMEEEDEDFNIKGKLPRSLDKRENVKLGSVISCLLGFTSILQLFCSDIWSLLLL